MKILNRFQYGKVFFVFVGILAFFIIFNHLDASSIYDWDETRNAENALEMVRTGDWLVTRWGEEPDLWNLKPPLGAWLMAVGFKIGGVSKFTIRFWSALFGVLTVMLVLWFGCRSISIWGGVAAAIFLLTVEDFLGVHGARTGDYDVMLTFFVSAAIFCFYLAAKTGRKIYWLGGGIATGFGFLVKSVVGFFPMPIVLLWFLYLKVSRKKFFLKGFWLGALSSLLVVVPWLTARYFAPNGEEFVKQMFLHDIRLRAKFALEGHYGDSWFYYHVLKDNLGRLFPLFVFFLTVCLLRAVKKAEAALFLIWLVLIFWAFSLAKTKIYWYLLPSWPAVGLLFGLAIDETSKMINKISPLLGRVFIFLCLFLIVFQINFKPKVEQDFFQESLEEFRPYLREMERVFVPQAMLRPNIWFQFHSMVEKGARGYGDWRDMEIKRGDGLVVNDPDEYKILMKDKNYQFLLRIHSLYLFERIN